MLAFLTRNDKKFAKLAFLLVLAEPLLLIVIDRIRIYSSFCRSLRSCGTGTPVMCVYCSRVGWVVVAGMHYRDGSGTW